MSSISGGFVNLTGLKTGEGPGKVFFDNIQQQVNALSCNSTSTALGDALCDSIDELRSSVLSTNTKQPRIALVTDAGENNSLRCGGGAPAYIANHITPRLLSPAPIVRMDISILAPGGNVTARLQNSAPSFELFNSTAVAPVAVGAGASNQITAAAATTYTPEVQALINAAQASGGGAIVIEDNKVCTSNCDPLSQGPSDDDDWGGAW